MSKLVIWYIIAGNGTAEYKEHYYWRDPGDRGYLYLLALFSS
jgi:hypothetical protein